MITNKDMADRMRRAADAIERGESPNGVTFVVFGPLDPFFGTANEAKNDAEEQIEPHYNSYDQDVDTVQWGVFVPFEVARRTVLTDEHSLEQAKLHDVDEWWDVSLVDAPT